MVKTAVIVAGGSGTRMQAAIPKQFLKLQGIPVLMHTIERFFTADNGMHIIVVLPQDQIPVWDNLCQEHDFTVQHSVVPGGASRSESVQNGLNLVNDGLVAIHDGVRPLITAEIIEQSFTTAEQKGSAIVYTPLKDSVRYVTESTSSAIDRSKHVAVQTPQTFKASLIKEAYNSITNFVGITDDASVYEKNGGRIVLFEGPPFQYQNNHTRRPDHCRGPARG